MASASKEFSTIQLKTGDVFERAGNFEFDLVKSEIDRIDDEVSLVKKNNDPNFDMGYVTVAIDRQPNVDFRHDVCVVRDVYGDFENIKISTEYETGELLDIEINVDGQLREQTYVLGENADVFLKAKFFNQLQPAGFVALRDGTVAIEELTAEGISGEFNGFAQGKGNIISGKFDLVFP